MAVMAGLCGFYFPLIEKVGSFFLIGFCLIVCGTLYFSEHIFQHKHNYFGIMHSVHFLKYCKGVPAKKIGDSLLTREP